MRVSVRIRVEAAARRYFAGESIQRLQHCGRRPLDSKRPGHGDGSLTCASLLSTARLSSDKRGGTPAPRDIAT
ncbi:unnamed protein product, partial [Brenthis ino]